MSFSYDPSALADNEIYQVRFALGDTEEITILMHDEEISYALQSVGSVSGTVIELCYRIAAKFSKQSEYTLGPYSIKLGQLAKNYLDLAERLKKQNISSKGSPTLGATPTPIFDIDLMTNVGGD